jgi:hypothetical protein
MEKLQKLSLHFVRKNFEKKTTIEKIHPLIFWSLDIVSAKISFSVFCWFFFFNLKKFSEQCGMTIYFKKNIFCDDFIKIRKKWRKIKPRKRMKIKKKFEKYHLMLKCFLISKV